MRCYTKQGKTLIIKHYVSLVEFAAYDDFKTSSSHHFFAPPSPIDIATMAGHHT